MFEALAGLGPALIGGGSSIAGGIISNLINQNQQENEATRNQVNFNTQMDETIQRRVADAKKAGLHPLYALGANAAPSSQPIIMQDSIGGSLNQAGQNISSALVRSGSQDDKIRTDLELSLLKHNIEKVSAETSLLHSEAAKLNQAALAGGGNNREMMNSRAPEGQSPMNLANVGNIMENPVPHPSSKEGHPELLAGIGETQEERWYGDVLPMIVPRLEGESLEEIWSEMSPGAFAGYIQLNQNKYGGRWWKDFVNLRYRGQQPSQNYLDLLRQGPRRRTDDNILSSESEKKKRFSNIESWISQQLKQVTDPTMRSFNKIKDAYTK